MSPVWSPDVTPELPPLGPVEWLRIALRGLLLSVILLAGLALLLPLRLVERPLFGARRPITPFITPMVCRGAYLVLGMGFRSEGRPMAQAGAVVANHASWMDIFSLNYRKRIYFVSKSEVARWPVIGFLARSVGTVFIARDPRQARAQTELFKERLLAGHKLLFFPEGTSSDGLRVLPFKPTLFQAFFSDGLRDRMHVQPVTVIYEAPEGQDPWFYGWWGDMDFGPHVLRVLGAARQGSVRVIYHAPVRVDAFVDRKALARHAETVVRGAMPPERRIG